MAVILTLNIIERENVMLQEFGMSPKRIARIEKIRKAIEMRQKGLTYAEIGENLKVCIATARNWTLKCKRGKIVI